MEHQSKYLAEEIKISSYEDKLFKMPETMVIELV